MVQENATSDAGPDSPAITFETELTSFGNNTGIVVPPEVIEALGAGKRPPLDVDVNGHRFRTTVGAMKGQQLISVSAAIRKETGLEGGDPVVVTVSVNTAPRTVELPEDFAEALRAQPDAEAFFAGLSNSVQRYHVDHVNGAKQPETRQRRIDGAIAKFVEGRPR